MHKVSAPALGWARRDWSRAPVQCDMFPPPHSHPQLKPIEPIQAANALAIDQPPFTPQQDPDPQIAKPRPRMSQIANAQPQGDLILRSTPSVPGGAAELRQPTGPQATDLKRLMKPVGQFSTACRPQTFFHKASDSMCLSSERSAIRCLSRAFSSSICRSRRSSLTPSWAHFFFQAYNVCSAMLSCRQTSPIRVPDSACRSA